MSKQILKRNIDLNPTHQNERINDLGSVKKKNGEEPFDYFAQTEVRNATFKERNAKTIKMIAVFLLPALIFFAIIMLFVLIE